MYYPTFTREDNQEANGVRVTVFVCDTPTGPVQSMCKYDQAISIGIEIKECT